MFILVRKASQQNGKISLFLAEVSSNCTVMTLCDIVLGDVC